MMIDFKNTIPSEKQIIDKFWSGLQCSITVEANSYWGDPDIESFYRPKPLELEVKIWSKPIRIGKVEVSFSFWQNLITGDDERILYVKSERMTKAITYRNTRGKETYSHAHLQSVCNSIAEFADLQKLA